MIPSFYLPITECCVNPDEWVPCGRCGKKPHLWIFDNGEQAKCDCNKEYDAPSATGISIWKYHNAHNGNMTNWNHNDLRDNWNEVAKQRTKKINHDTSF